MAESAAMERALQASSPMASGEATTTGEHVIDWLKITLVPLLVFLIGACMWSCCKKSSAWSKVTEDGGSVRNEAADSARSIDSDHVARDLEAGLELSHSPAETRTATLANVESADKAAATDSTSTNETTSDIGNGLHC